MKIGDKVYCIKTHAYGDFIVVKKDKIYDIVDFGINLETVDKFVETTSEVEPKFWSIDTSGPYYVFSAYFMTEKEYRKEKLDKINESNLL